MTRMPRAWAAASIVVEVGQRAEERVDVAVVGDVVAGVLLRGGLNGLSQMRVDAEALRGRRGGS